MAIGIAANRLELLQIADAVAREKGIEKEVVIEAIEDALRRIDDGTYGVCRDCGEAIAPARLDAIPWTRVCIACKEKQKA